MKITTSIANNKQWLLFIVLVTTAVAHSFFQILLPILSREFLISDINAGLIVSASALAMTFSAPVWGYICDKLGRRFVIIVTVLLVAVFTILLACIIKLGIDLYLTASSIAVALLLLRVSQALASAGIMPAAQAFIADTTSRKSRASGMGMLGAAFGIGSIGGGAMALSLGYAFAVYGFLFIGLGLLLISVFIIRSFNETPEFFEKTANPATPPMPYKQLWFFLVNTFLALTIYSLLMQVTAWRLQDDFLMSTDQATRLTGAVVAITMIAMIIGQGVLVRYLNWQPITLLRRGAALALISLSLATIARTEYQLIACMASLGSALGLLIPGNLAMMSLLVNEQQQARIAGINAMLKGLGLAAGPIMGAYLHQLAPFVPYLMTSVLALLIILISLLFKTEVLMDEAITT